MDLFDALINNVIETGYDNLPADAVEASRKQFLDILAATIGGSTCSISGDLEGLVELVKDWGGKEESSILAFGGRVPAHNAAFINGILCTRLDFDDTFALLVRNHPSRSIVPVALAMAERQGNIDGKQLLTAIALGHDLQCRLKLGVGRDAESPLGFTTNFIGASATAGKLLGLKRDEFKNALSIAYHLISGAKSGMGTAGAGASLKGVNNGVTVQSGISSVLLAQKGISSNWDFLDIGKKNNFYDVFYNGSCVPPLITKDLGEVFLGSKTSLKEFPCCHGQHPALEATLSLIKEHGIKAADVAEVKLYLSPVDFLLLASPVEKKQSPANKIETQFSLCWGVASAIVYGNVEIRNFTDEALENAEVRKIALKVYPEMDISMAGPIHCPCKVEIKTTDNKVFAMVHDHAPLGSSENPLDFSFIADKFRQCCKYSVKPIPEKNQNTVIDMVADLEKVNDVGEIARLLA